MAFSGVVNNRDLAGERERSPSPLAPASGSVDVALDIVARLIDEPSATAAATPLNSDDDTSKEVSTSAAAAAIASNPKMPIRLITSLSSTTPRIQRLFALCFAAANFSIDSTALVASRSHRHADLTEKLLRSFTSRAYCTNAYVSHVETHPPLLQRNPLDPSQQ